MSHKSILAFLLLCLAAWSVPAQVNEKESEKVRLERQNELQRKTLALVDEIVAGTPSLKLPENRSYILAAGADLLWEHDQKRARNLFWESLNTLNLVNASSGNSSSKEQPKTAAQRDYYATYYQRRTVLQLAARRDAQFALDLLTATRQPSPEQTGSSFRVPDERELEQQIASEAAARDPQRALQLARESLAKGLTFELINLLYRLIERDGEAATKFAGEIIDKLRTENLATDFYGFRIAIQLIFLSRTQTSTLLVNSSVTHFESLKLKEDQKRELIEMLTSAAFSVSISENLIASLPEIMAEIEQFTPGRVALLQRKLAEYTSTLPEKERLWSEGNQAVRGGNPEEIFRAAWRTDGEQRASLERQAVIAAVFSRKIDSIRDFINKELKDESRRQRLNDSLDAEEIDYAAYRGDYGSLREMLPQIRVKEERARAMARLAVLLERKGEHDEALKLVDEAQTLIKTDLRSETRTNALLELVFAYALIEPNRAFVILERTIERANDEIRRLLMLDKLAKSGAVKKGEILLQQPAVIPQEFLLFKYVEGLSALAQADFIRTKALADKFERNELRLNARLLIAQALMRREKQK